MLRSLWATRVTSPVVVVVDVSVPRVGEVKSVGEGSRGQRGMKGLRGKRAHSTCSGRNYEG